MLELTAVHLAPGEGQALPEGERRIAAYVAPEVFELPDGFVVAVLHDELLGLSEQIRDVVANERERRHRGKLEE
jgi:hypothetical protein